MQYKRASGITAGSPWLTGSFLPVRRVASVARSTRTRRWQTESGFVAVRVLVTTGISTRSNLGTRRQFVGDVKRLRSGTALAPVCS